MSRKNDFQRAFEPPRVVVEVRGGVAWVADKSPSVEVKIIDWDSIEAGDSWCTVYEADSDVVTQQELSEEDYNHE